MRRTLSKRQLPDSALKYILEGLIPYTEANLKLSFKPHLFFNDLENIEKQKKFKAGTYRNVFYKAQKQGYISYSRTSGVKITSKGHRLLQPFTPKLLPYGAQLMVIFDIPEIERSMRSYLRKILRECQFEQVQKSVWVSKYDSKEYLQDVLDEYGLNKYVIVYEALALNR
jgi:DNA-binding transcriptional regulator PaaX